MIFMATPSSSYFQLADQFEIKEDDGSIVPSVRRLLLLILKLKISSLFSINFSSSTMDVSILQSIIFFTVLVLLFNLYSRFLQEITRLPELQQLIILKLSLVQTDPRSFGLSSSQADVTTRDYFAGFIFNPNDREPQRPSEEEMLEN